MAKLSQYDKDQERSEHLYEHVWAKGLSRMTPYTQYMLYQDLENDKDNPYIKLWAEATYQVNSDHQSDTTLNDLIEQTLGRYFWFLSREGIEQYNTTAKARGY